MSDAPRLRSGAEYFFGGPPGWVVLKLVLLSIVVGVILAVLDLDVFSLLRWLQRLFYDLFENAWDALDSVLRWFLLGAMIVFPIWLVARLLRLGNR